MATHDYVIANGTGAAVRSDLNDALAAIVSNNSSSSEPGTTYAYQWWADTNANVLKIRNSANNAWITLRELDGTMLIEDGSASTPGLAFADDVNTGIFSPAADQIGFATDGTERLEIGSSEVVFNDPSNDVDFRVESNGQTHMLFVEGGTDRVGIGESDPDQTLHISEAASGTTMGVIIHNTATANDSDARLTFNTNSGGAEKTRAYIQAAGNTSSDGNLIFATRKSGSTSESARIDSSGRVGIATTPENWSGFDALEVNEASIVSSGAGDAFFTANAYYDGAWKYKDAGVARNIYMNADGIVFRQAASGSADAAVAWSESMRVDTSGRLLVNTSSSFNDGSTIQLAGSDSHLGFKYTGTTGGNEQQIRWFDKRDQANAVIANNLTNDNSGAQAAHLVFKTSTSGTLSERARLTDGGNFLVGQTNASFGTQGHILGPNGQAYHICSGDSPLLVNRQSNDGELVRLAQDGATEGNITVSGSSVSYNGGHLSRWSQLAGGAERAEILRGSVLSNLDEMCEWAYEAQDAVLYTEEDELPEGVSVGDVKTPAIAAGTEDNEQLNRMKVSDVEGDVNVSGVFQAWDDDDDTYTNDFYCAMTGDFVIRIAQGTTVARGDLLMSAGDGTAKPQDDDIVRSKTIAKVTSTTVSTTYSDGSYCVPCVLMAC